MKKTLVLGASSKTHRTSYQVIRRLISQGYEVRAVGARKSMIDDVSITPVWPQDIDIHTITVYLSAENQRQYHDAILETNPNRIIFNPGAENPDLMVKAKQQGIEAINACTLVMLSLTDF